MRASPGDKLLAESGGTFYNAKVVQVSSTSENAFVLVHFLGWNERYDERIPVGMGRLRPMDESAEAELLMYVDAEHGVAYVVLTSHTDGLDMIARGEVATAVGSACIGGGQGIALVLRKA